MIRTLSVLLLVASALPSMVQAPPEVVWEFVGADDALVKAFALVDPADGTRHGLPGFPYVTFDFPNTPDAAYFDGISFHYLRERPSPT